jgi:hypothetical protein
MRKRVVTAMQLKAKCLALLDEVNSGGRSFPSRPLLTETRSAIIVVVFLT